MQSERMDTEYASWIQHFEAVTWTAIALIYVAFIWKLSDLCFKKRNEDVCRPLVRFSTFKNDVCTLSIPRSLLNKRGNLIHPSINLKEDLTRIRDWITRKKLSTLKTRIVQLHDRAFSLIDSELLGTRESCLSAILLI